MSLAPDFFKKLVPIGSFSGVRISPRIQLLFDANTLMVNLTKFHTKNVIFRLGKKCSDHKQNQTKYLSKGL